MNGNLESLRRAASILLLGVAFSGCALGPRTPSSELSDSIEAALHHSDHEGLITYYKEAAVAARDKVNLHRRLAASYRTPSSAGGAADPRMAAHCDAIARLYEQITLEYEGMVQFHQLLEREPALRKP